MHNNDIFFFSIQHFVMLLSGLNTTPQHCIVSSLLNVHMYISHHIHILIAGTCISLWIYKYKTVHVYHISKTVSKRKGKVDQL